jgi:hypothetical protein
MPNNIWWWVQIMKLPIVQHFPAIVFHILRRFHQANNHKSSELNFGKP